MKSTRKSATPTVETYSSLQVAFDFFNVELFDGRLPEVLITLQRSKRSYGHYGADRFQARLAEAAPPKSPSSNLPEQKPGVVGNPIAELNLNPEHFGTRTERAILSTLVHEMVHARQHAEGKPSRSGYHNAQWADMMDEVGLTPSSTGEPGGKRVGDRVSHVIVEGGPFARAFARLKESGWRLAWARAPEEPGDKKPPTRLKFTCESCGMAAWAKATAHLVCGDCGEELTPEEPGEAREPE